MELTPDQVALRDAVRGLLARHHGDDDSGPWRRLAREIGVAGLAIPERYGGAGAGPVEIHIVLEELGRGLTPAPMLGSAVLATGALLAAGDDAACRRLLPGLAAGTTTAALAWTGPAGHWDPAHVACRASAAAPDAPRRVSAETRGVPGPASAEAPDVTRRASPEASDVPGRASAEAADAARRVSAEASDVTRPASAKASGVPGRASAEAPDAADRVSAETPDAPRRVSAEASGVPGHASAEAAFVTGQAHYVLDGAGADVLLVAAGGPDGIGLYEVDPAQPGVSRAAVTTLDETRRLATVRLDNAAARRLGQRLDLARLRDLACIALSAEQVGAARQALGLTVAYTKVRKQFGQAIGSFQGLQHRLADLHVLVESARSLSYAAAEAAAGDDPDLALRAAAARTCCSEALSRVAAEMIQMHGAIGITWEHEAHRYFKRAHGDAQLLGPPSDHVSRIAAALLDP
ncbi:MAG: acyl-CoA dehydrogenase family protein [Streptosporangiaceae bacterium]